MYGHIGCSFGCANSCFSSLDGCTAWKYSFNVKLEIFFSKFGRWGAPSHRVTFCPVASAPPFPLNLGEIFTATLCHKFWAISPQFLDHYKSLAALKITIYIYLVLITLILQFSTINIRPCLMHTIWDFFLPASSKLLLVK